MELILWITKNASLLVTYHILLLFYYFLLFGAWIFCTYLVFNYIHSWNRQLWNIWLPRTTICFIFFNLNFWSFPNGILPRSFQNRRWYIIKHISWTSDDFLLSLLNKRRCFIIWAPLNIYSLLMLYQIFIQFGLKLLFNERVPVFFTYLPTSKGLIRLQLFTFPK
jgi:hypothetical protein